MAEVEIPFAQVTRQGVEHEPGVSDAGDGLYLAANDGNKTVFVSGTGTFRAVPAPALAGWPDFAEEDITLSGETVEAGPWPPAVFNRADGSVLFEADAGLTFTASGI